PSRCKETDRQRRSCASQCAHTFESQKRPHAVTKKGIWYVGCRGKQCGKQWRKVLDNLRHARVGLFAPAILAPWQLDQVQFDILRQGSRPLAIRRCATTAI